MIVRRCAGGVVFYANKVLLLKNDRHEWTLPKGKVLEGQLAADSAVCRVKDETGVNACPLVVEILCMNFSQEVDNNKFVMQ